MRSIAGAGSRLTCKKAEMLEVALLQHGIQCYPGLADTSAASIRFYRPSTMAGRIIDMGRYPSEENDRALAEAVKKMKGQWNWEQ